MSFRAKAYVITSVQRRRRWSREEKRTAVGALYGAMFFYWRDRGGEQAFGRLCQVDTAGADAGFNRSLRGVIIEATCWALAAQTRRLPTRRSIAMSARSTAWCHPSVWVCVERTRPLSLHWSRAVLNSEAGKAIDRSFKYRVSADPLPR
jgi:hypothetical protein